MSVSIQNLSKKFGDNVILKDFNLNVQKGDIAVILGESGSGKTTLVRILNHLEQLDEGSIIIDDVPLVTDGVYSDKETLAQYQLKIGFVFQDYQLFANLSVLDNLMLAPKSQNLGTDAELEAKALQLLDQMGIGDKANFKPQQLSGGQQQRVAIARAMMLDPSLICFDEPTSALDAKTVSRVVDLIKTIAADGRSILIITHDQQFVDAIQKDAANVQVIESDSFK